MLANPICPSIRRVRRPRLLGTNGNVLDDQNKFRSPRVAALFWRRIEGCTLNWWAKRGDGGTYGCDVA